METYCLKHLELAKPTYLEQWPAALRRLSLAQPGIPLGVAQMDAMMAAIEEIAKPEHQAVLDALGKAVDELLPDFPKGAFVKLGSRSPKDGFFPDGLKMLDGRLAVAVMCTSMRVFDDLALAKAAGYQPWIFLREWKDIPAWTEFRCFMQGRKLTGISQYYYRECYPDLVKYAGSIEWAIQRFFEKDFRDACHLDDVVFDVFVTVREKHSSCILEVKLLEINPYSVMTDPCLFSWHNYDFFRGQMRFIESPDDLKPPTLTATPPDLQPFQELRA
jgi:hypothetical protein